MPHDAWILNWAFAGMPDGPNMLTSPVLITWIIKLSPLNDLHSTVRVYFGRYSVSNVKMVMYVDSVGIAVTVLPT